MNLDYDSRPRFNHFDQCQIRQIMINFLFSQFQMAAAKAAGKVTRNQDSGVGMLMNLRKIANHPLLSRNHFDQSQIRQLAKLLKKDPSHEAAVEKFIIEDMSVMSDFDIHKTCLAYRVSTAQLL